MSTDAVQMCCDIQPFLKIIKLVISLIQWTVPLVLIVLGTVDMFKAVASGDEKVVKDVQSTFIKRLIYGVLIFLVPFCVRLILNFVNNNLIHDGSGLTSATSWIDCWNGTVSCGSTSSDANKKDRLCYFYEINNLQYGSSTPPVNSSDGTAMVYLCKSSISCSNTYQVHQSCTYVDSIILNGTN